MSSQQQLDIGLARKHGKLTGTQSEAPLMTPDAMPVTRWANAGRIEVVKRRSPIMGGDSNATGRSSTAGTSNSSLSASRSRRSSSRGGHGDSSSTIPTASTLAAKNAADKAHHHHHHHQTSTAACAGGGMGGSSSVLRVDDLADAPPPDLSYASLTHAANSNNIAHQQQPITASHLDTSLVHQHHHQHEGFLSPSPVPAASAGGAVGGKNSSSTSRKRSTVSNSLVVSPVRFIKNKTDKDVDFVFVQKQPDPIKEQMRRAESIIAAIPNRSAAQLASVVDNGSALSSAAVLDGLSRRTALLQHDKTRSDRTASAVMGCHIAALLDLSRSLAITDPNASEVARRVHDVLTSHVVKSVEEPLERVSLLYESTKEEVSEVREQCVDLRSQLLDTQAEVQNLRRQLRRRDDVIAYLTSAYNLPTVFKDSATENKEMLSQVMAEEASPSALMNQKRVAECQRQLGGGTGGGGGGSGSGSGRRGMSPLTPTAGVDDDDAHYGRTEIDPNKSLQEQFQVIIPKKK